MEKLINSKFYQVFTLIIDLIILNIIGAVISILSLGTLLVSSVNSCFIMTKELLYSSNHSLIKGFIVEIKDNWRFNLKLSLYVLFTLVFFVVYGYSIYALIFILNEGFVGIMLLGLAITMFVMYIVHLVNMFIFNSYFGFNSFSYTFKASLLIMSKRKSMSGLMILLALVTSFILYIEPLLSIFGLVAGFIYLVQLVGKNTYEKLKNEEDERREKEKLVK